MTKKAPLKSLKDQNRWQLWLTIAINVAVFCSVAQTDTVSVSGIKGVVTNATNLLPVGLALIVTSVANGLLSADMKARLVFFRWKYPLPGHRAFSKYANSDPRIDLERLKGLLDNKIPTTPADENRAWYRFLKEVEADPAVQHIHREFLFTRDYTGFSVLILLIFGAVSSIILTSWRVALIYDFCLILQFGVVRQAAATYGARFVCTVLALKSVVQLNPPL